MSRISSLTCARKSANRRVWPRGPRSPRCSPGSAAEDVGVHCTLLVDGDHGAADSRRWPAAGGEAKRITRDNWWPCQTTRKVRRSGAPPQHPTHIFPHKPGRCLDRGCVTTELVGFHRRPGTRRCVNDPAAAAAHPPPEWRGCGHSGLVHDLRHALHASIARWQRQLHHPTR